MVFEGDYKHLVSLLSSTSESGSALSPVLYDILLLLTQNPLWTETFIYQEANMAAHSLAKLACLSIMIYFDLDRGLP